MNPASSMRMTLLLPVLANLIGCASPPVSRNEPAVGPEFRARFLRFCDLAFADLNKPMEPFRFKDRDYANPATHHMPAFEDAHAVRALCTAYDLTGDHRYFDAARRWSDWVLDCQRGMIPKGAYYMNHSRAPGEDHGQWNAADSGSVGMAVLATAVRCRNAADQERYLASVRSFLKLMIDNYVTEEGGICNGCWSKYAGPWWCSTSVVGRLALMAYEVTGEKQYLDVGTRALKWTVDRDFRTVGPITFKERPSGIIFYNFDFYAAGFKQIKPGTSMYEPAVGQIDLALAWLAEHQKTRVASVPDYTAEEVDMAGMPYLMYAFARQFPRYGQLVATADKEMQYIGDLLLAEGEPNVSRLMIWEVMTWGMLSYAERLLPGSISEGRVVPTPRDVAANVPGGE